MDGKELVENTLQRHRQGYHCDMTSNCTWPWGPVSPELAKNSLHVWCVSLEVGETRLHSLKDLLSEDERSRAESYHFERHRRRYIACRGQLRKILAGYIQCSTTSIEFQYGDRGKPDLAAGQTASKTKFNVSKSEELALIAVTNAGHIGIDIEHLRPVSDAAKLAQRYFAAPEVETLLSAPTSLHERIFLEIWTRKEAFIKATGQGLSYPLNQFAVSAAHTDPVVTVKFLPDSAKSEDWHLTNISPQKDVLAAVAVCGTSPQITCWRCPN